MVARGEARHATGAAPRRLERPRLVRNRLFQVLVVIRLSCAVADPRGFRFRAQDAPPCDPFDGSLVRHADIRTSHEAKFEAFYRPSTL